MPLLAYIRSLLFRRSIILEMPLLVCSAGKTAKRTNNWCSLSTKENDFCIFISMKVNYPTEWPQFYTATILNWQHLLQDDKYKNIIVESLQFCVKEKRLSCMRLPRNTAG
jgi:hypothetical protein